MFYRLYFFYCPNSSLPHVIIEDFMKNIVSFQKIENIKNKHYMVFITFHHAYNQAFHEDLETFLQVLAHDFSSPVFGFVSKIFDENYPLMESIYYYEKYILSILPSITHPFYLHFHSQYLAALFSNMISEQQVHFSELNQDKKNFISYMELLSSKQHHVIDTLLHFGGNSSIASKFLYLHRNTLAYQLQKIIQIIGFDPREYLDATLFFSYFDYIKKMKKEIISPSQKEKR